MQRVKRAAVRPGTRRKQVLAELKKGPGTAGELARRAGMASTGIYPVLKKLHSDGKAAKAGAVYSLAEKRRRTPLSTPGNRRPAKDQAAVSATRVDRSHRTLRCRSALPLVPAGFQLAPHVKLRQVRSDGGPPAMVVIRTSTLLD